MLQNVCGVNVCSKDVTTNMLRMKILDMVKYSDVEMQRVCRVTEKITKGYELLSPEG